MINVNLKMLRNACGLTQQRIADMLNIDRSTYSYYETGKTKPDVETLIKISRIYYVTLDALVNNHFELGKARIHTEQLSKPEHVPPQLFSDLDREEQNVVLLFRMCKDRDTALRILHEFMVSNEYEPESKENPEK